MKLKIVIEKMANVDILRRKTIFCYISQIYFCNFYFSIVANEENLNVKSQKQFVQI